MHYLPRQTCLLFTLIYIFLIGSVWKQPNQIYHLHWSQKKNSHYFGTMVCALGLATTTSSNGNIFRVTGPLCGALCAGNSPVTGEFPAQRPVTRSFAVFIDRRLSTCLSKQSWGWWFETLSRPLWRNSAFACGPCSPAFEERMRAAMGATGERSVGRPHNQCGMCIDSYQFLPAMSSFVIICTYLFTADDNHLQKSTILSSVICRYTGHQQSLHQPKFGHFFSENLIVKSYGSFAL